MPKQKALRVSEATWRNLAERKMKEQIKTGKCVSMDKIIQKFLMGGKITLDIPKDVAERLKRMTKIRFGTESLEEGIPKVLEEWVKERGEE